MRRYPLVGTIGVAVLAMAALGCDDTAKGMKKDAEENAEAAKPYVDAAAAKAKEKLQEAAENAKPAAEQAGEKLKELGGKAAEEAKDLGHKASDKASEGAEKAEDKSAGAGDTVSAAAQTTMVKAALMADSGVDSSGIDVDTEAATKTVMLKGSVPTAAQKTTAERIARSKVSKGYSVHNMLTVAPKS